MTAAPILRNTAYQGRSIGARGLSAHKTGVKRGSAWRRWRCFVRISAA